jgi:hypothetical protein
MIGSSKFFRAGLVTLALAAAPLQAANAPASTKLSVAQAAGNAEVMKLPVCKGNDTTPCRKATTGAGGNVVWVVMGAAVVAGAIVAASAGSP